MTARWLALTEAAVNTVVGYGIALALSWWLTGASLTKAAEWSVYFVIASLARGYAVRRGFARLTREA